MRDSFFSSLLLVGEAKKRGASPRAIDGAKNLKITRTAGSHSCSRLDTHTSHLSPNGNPINNNPRDWMLIIPLLPQPIADHIYINTVQGDGSSEQQNKEKFTCTTFQVSVNFW